ncbi:UDP-N-acetylenolpyruvoylglucosamine reductase [Candidatus Kaiserbacteria bacterium RIFCSPHIGHO2_02_FULL_54_11b]|uniref:UDP-N-acetylenolpyruvoylglucosamine reductase n=2 Tax=Candidatus Kaiseribacteriota TaxID=1752734 RepID=A0A1F6CMJ2_9BACT|nr:MAG: UDP-N-acetylenolpyruvoylglucosamine reductase [Candidatus Kaiserbacteria bacterium RIFCSPHIGHO2_01_FULL_54_36b]OGG64316.1 MAG: UDP-N-acetylenolpyruvoylglucosamine reductase [Candidatus Kaiserbacteria bacterium RIFCSPHIGHO2_02_FULL_54_11b]
MALNIKENIPLAPLTTFEIGGSAKYLVSVRSESDIREAIQWAKEKKIPYAILAGGSNVLVPDQGLDALVIRLRGDLYGFSGDIVDAWAGTNLLAAIKSMGKQGYGGWEKLAGIPGTIGGAVRGNAGAFGPEIKDFVVRVRALNAETGELRDFTNSECDFSYRHSFFKDHPEWIITRVILQLEKVESAESTKLAEATIAEREKRHLQNVRAAGSFFMNPKAPPEIVAMFEKEKKVKSREGRVPAGWLIEKAGMKGATVGGAIASLQHPNYIVNQGNATAVDVKALADKVQKAVNSQFGVALYEEAAIL